jgi:hypothetical protein
MPAPADLPLGLRRQESLFAPSERARGAQRAPAARRVPARERRRRTAKHSRLANIPPLAFAAAIAVPLFIGWYNREEGHLTPATGTGYWLGIAGASAMVLLLLYPLRKRMNSLRRLGSVGGWFRLHMMLGIVGPALILIHSNFKLGALNSNVALVAMLTVAASGLIGRYLYRRIHFGLYGRRAEIEELLADVDDLKNPIEGGLLLPDDLYAALEAYAARALAGRSGAASSLLALLGLRLRGRSKRARLMRETEQHVRVAGKEHRWSWRVTRKRSRNVRELLGRFFEAVNKAAAFAFYERLFALWHVLHVPFFILLVLTAIVHVFAVHLY